MERAGQEHGRRCAEPAWSPKAPGQSGADIAKNGSATQRSKMPGFYGILAASDEMAMGTTVARPRVAVTQNLTS